jgi:exosome complex RNA-binding protein Rrp4
MAKRISFTETDKENINIEAFLNTNGKIWVSINDTEDPFMATGCISLDIDDAKEFAELILNEIKLSENE